MNHWIWKAKQFVRKYLPIVLIASVAYAGFTAWNKGAFRRGIKPGLTQTLYSLPYFGSRFKHYNRSSSVSRSKYGHSRRVRGGKYGRRRGTRRR